MEFFIDVIEHLDIAQCIYFQFQGSVMENIPWRHTPSPEGDRNFPQSNRVQDKEFLEMTDSGRCLSMHQPWASLLILGIKL